MVDIGATYADGRARISKLLADVTDDDAQLTVPACPGWTVHDVAAHLVGTCADILAGNLDGMATEVWTAAQVEGRKGTSLGEILAEWSEVGPPVEAFAHAFPGRSGDQWIADQVTHEHDIRGALGRPGGRDGLGIEVGLDFLVGVGFASSLASRGLGPLEIRSGDRQWVVGSETPTTSKPVAVVEASPFDLFRALTGRRSVRQVESFAWSIEPSAFVAAFEHGPFATRSDDLVE